MKSDYTSAIDALEDSIAKNKDNIFAYLALGDALEK